MSLNQKFYCDLEDYVCEIENQQSQSAGDCDDVYAQLAKKEKDLMVAAELGKALLEKNEELSRANERLTEEYSQQLELLEQEKHGLRRKLDSLEAEYDGHIEELQSDLVQLQKEVEEHQTLLRNMEREKGQLVQELTEHNHGLAAELKQVTLLEKHHQAELKALREQYSIRNSNLHDQISQLEGLKEEISLLEERKADLEQKIHSLVEDRDSLNLSLEVSDDRIFMLQKHNRNQEQQLRNQQRDLEELHHANSQLQVKLDVMLGRTPGNSLPSFQSDSGMLTSSSLEHDSLGECQLPQELVSLYHQLWRLCDDLRRRRDSMSVDSGIPPTPVEIQTGHLKVGMFTSLLKELQDLVEELIANADHPCLACQTIVEENDTLEHFHKELQQKEDDMKQKTEEMAQMSIKIAIQEKELAALREERDHLRQDIDSSNMAKDEIVKKVWTMRDQAVARKNTVEIELAKTRIDVMHINSQLMEAVQQKVELSQQLDQWQLDLQALLEDQMKNKLRSHELEEMRHKSRIFKRFGSKNKIFSLWR